MGWLHEFRMRWQAFLRPRQLDRDLEDEIRFHLHMRENRNVEAGMTARDASYRARKQFGNPTLRKESLRAMWDGGILERFAQDVTYGLRTMRKNPVFVATAILTLALTIGGNTAMFMIIRAVLLKPLRYRDPDRLVRVTDGATPTRFAEMRTAGRSFAEFGAYTRQENVTLSGIGEPEVLRGVHVSAGFLRILGVEPIRGRGFRADEDSRGGARVALISSEVWRRRFANDPNIAGRTATLDAGSYTIVGVLPPGFQFPSADLDVWMTNPSDLQTITERSRVLSPHLTVFGRLQDGMSLERANAEMKVIRRQYAMAHPGMLDAKPKRPAELVSMKDQLVSGVRSTLWMLFGAVGFVLLIACANLASLLLARATSRRQEFGLRSALGASRGRLIAQLLTESISLSVAGGVSGVLLAELCVRAIPSMTAIELPRAEQIRVDWVAVLFAAGLSIATGLLFGLAPSIGASRPDLASVLRASGESTGRRVRSALLSLRGLLSAGQVALCVVLLIGATLLMESIVNLRGVTLGFNPANLLTVSVNLPPSRYETDRKVARFFDDVNQRLGSLPGVAGVAAAMSLPTMAYPGVPVQEASRPLRPLNERLIAKYFPVTPGYFRTLEIALTRGRLFTEHDNLDGQRVAIIDENMARHFWPAYPAGPDPVGQRLWVGGVNPKPAEIVGIAVDVSQNLDSREDWQEGVYVPFAQNPMPNVMLVLRTAGDPLSFARAVGEQVRTLDRDQPIGAAQTMEARVEKEVGERRVIVGLLGSFAITALVLAVIGIYGVIAYSVAQRVREIGIRQALGAQPSDILRLVMGQGIALSLGGVLVGLLGALALTRVMGALLFNVAATDPLTFMAVALIFLVVALFASYIPARRATTIDPIATLRV